MQRLAASILETASAWEQDGSAQGAGRESMGAVDATFLDQLLLVLQDLPRGYLLLEATAEDRSDATWNAWVQARLQTLSTGVLSLVSDRAKALMQWAAKGRECLRMPACFHCVHDIVTSYALALGRRLRPAHKDLQQAEASLEHHRSCAHADGAGPEAQTPVEAQQAEGR
jgi:hypothetical protein